MIEIGAIVWGVKEIDKSVEFWTKALNYRVKGAIEEDWAILEAQVPGQINFSLKKVSSPKAPRHHLDLYADNLELEVSRLKKLGASEKNWNYPDNANYIVLEDPEGNPFCVIQK